MHKLKLSIDLEMPQEQDYKPSLMEKVQDCMEQVEFGDSPEAYHFLRQVNNCAVKCYKAGKKSPKLHELLGILTPFLAKHGLEDWRGIELIDGYVTNPDYQEEESDG